jgi:hypothetical protein
MRLIVGFLELNWPMVDIADETNILKLLNKLGIKRIASTYCC